MLVKSCLQSKMNENHQNITKLLNSDRIQYNSYKTQKLYISTLSILYIVFKLASLLTLIHLLSGANHQNTAIIMNQIVIQGIYTFFGIL
jgi:hypothetical protein